MIPVRDENDCETIPIINYLLIAVNVAVLIFECIPCELSRSFNQEFACSPFLVVHHFCLVQFATLFTSTFMHAGLGHLASNMWVLWLFGDNVEDRLGHFNYLVFYVVCGLIASCAQIISNPNETMCCVGASGAIAGVLGAYMMLFPHVKVTTWITLFWFAQIPAWLIMSAWFALQCFSAMSPNSEMIGWFAHIGGFMAGIALLYCFKPRKHPRFIDLDGIKVPYSESNLAAEEELLPSNGYSTAIGAAILLAFICVSLSMMPKSLPLRLPTKPLTKSPTKPQTKPVIVAPRAHAAPSKRQVKKSHPTAKNAGTH